MKIVLTKEITVNSMRVRANLCEGAHFFKKRLYKESLSF